jgi:hypothetical protein
MEALRISINVAIATVALCAIFMATILPELLTRLPDGKGQYYFAQDRGPRSTRLRLFSPSDHSRPWGRPRVRYTH